MIPARLTTIPGDESITTRNWSYFGMYVREEVIQSIILKREELETQTKSLGLPLKFVSFAVQILGIKSNSRKVMLLGCPQIGKPRQSKPQIVN